MICANFFLGESERFLACYAICFDEVKSGKTAMDMIK